MMQGVGTTSDDGEALLHNEHAATSCQPSTSTPHMQSKSKDNDDDNVNPSKPRRIITLPLIRKRSEHNEGLVSSLEELALHQEELQSIGPILGRTCGKTLKILLLQNNVIGRMIPSELKLFRSLEYLNLALNNIQKIEGLNGMEWLKKLDLTLNFIDVDALEASVNELAGCRSLEELYLLGNPCMGLEGGLPGVDGATASPPKQIGWKGCRPYIIARLPNLQSLDGKEVKRSERILATQQLSALVSELHQLAESRAKERHLENQTQQSAASSDGSATDEGYISDEAPTHHNPETRTKLSNELYDQKQAKEKQETANQPKHRGEKEWEEEHNDMVEKVREREERGREIDEANKGMMKKDGGIKQCNQGKYQFWFEEESSPKRSPEDNSISAKKAAGSLIMRIDIPKHLSTSLIDVDIHPTYASIVIKSKILRVILPCEVVSSKSVARRSAASGHLELVMPKVDPEEVIVGLCHVRDTKSGKNEIESNTNENGAKGNAKMTNKKPQSTSPKKRERLGQSLMKEAGIVDSLNIVQQHGISSEQHFLANSNDDDSDDEPPPLF